MFKLNASPKNQAANIKKLTNLKAAGWTVDRDGHAILKVAGKSWRYKFQAETISREVLAVVHPANRTSTHAKSWVCISTASYADA